MLFFNVNIIIVKTGVIVPHFLNYKLKYNFQLLQGICTYQLSI